jgi:hypothetical protein
MRFSRFVGSVVAGSEAVTANAPMRRYTDVGLKRAANDVLPSLPRRPG